jgi:hypothetical protein
MVVKKYEAFGTLILLLLFCWLWNTVPIPLIGHIESIHLIKRNNIPYTGKYNLKDFDDKSIILLVGCTTSEISDFMSSQNDIPAMQNCVYIFMIPHQESGFIENTPSSRKDVFIDASLNEDQLARQFYIEYNQYNKESEPNHKMVLFIDKTGEIIDGYQFNRPSHNQGKKLNSTVIDWSNKRFTCNDYDLQSIIDFLSSSDKFNPDKKHSKQG